MYQRGDAHYHDFCGKYWVNLFTKKLNTFILLLITALSCFTTGMKANGATMIANSVEDFSTQQGQYGWYYGFDDGSGFKPNGPTISDIFVPGEPNLTISPPTDDITTQWGKFNKDGGYFSGQDRPEWVIRRWQSNFNGVVNLRAKLQETAGNQSAMDFHTKIFVDAEEYVFEDRQTATGSSQYDFNVEVNVGSTIDFAFAPNDENWEGGFDFAAEITIPSGLVFRKSNNGKGDEVGLFFEDQVYEANKEYQEGSYWDHLTRDYKDIAADEGVQDQHSLGSFLHNSREQNSSPINGHEHIELDWETAKKMASLIRGRLNAGYEYNSTALTSPYIQKGGYGNFSNSGLIEWAAEEADVNGGQGFIPYHFEAIPIINNNVFTQEDVDRGYLSGKISSFNYKTNERSTETVGVNGGQGSIPSYLEQLVIQERLYQAQKNIYQTNRNFYHSIGITDFKSTPTNFPYITPKRFNFWLKQGQDSYADSWFQGSFESVEFILTDPKGRKLGYTKDKGVFNHIPDTFLEEVDNKIHFIIPNREFDDYQIDIFDITKKSVGSIIVDTPIKTPIPESQNSKSFIFLLIVVFVHNKKLKPKIFHHFKK